MIGIDTNILIACEVPEHPAFHQVHAFFDREIDAGIGFAIAPQVIAEFIHAVTDPKRFAQPLSVLEAVERAEIWQNSLETTIVGVDVRAFELFFEWMRVHRLGRKRVLDTMLAATYSAHGIARIATLNCSDFQVFDAFEFAL
ncbi:type II toxin-antitoxin system VapC family toxin [Anatilimnocola floriformis]|uniref:type II toxin-antitoxin system VapC family toxin n=1 Tax=Anatilimnocola floriformis TaxID=2948575 RepID=UPI0020C1DCCB|nr:PIN domain-containing protein [Anatilimnocola floriformis]